MTAEGFSGPPGASATTLSTDLVARAQRGEEAAFAALFEAHKRRVYALCLRMTHSTEDAEDLTQEAFLQVFRKIATFRGESTFSTWLHRLTVNGVLMHLRKKRLQQESLPQVDNSQEEPATREYRDDDRRLMGTIDRINLDDALAHLSPGYRKALVLYDLEGYEHREIAQMTQRSVSNSKTQLRKARRKLRDWLCLRGGRECSTNAGQVGSEYEGKKGSTSGDRAEVRGVNHLEPGIVTR